MFDQPELEALLRTNLARYPRASCAAASRSPTSPTTGDGRVRVTYSDRADGEHVWADSVLGCDGANSLTRAAIGAAMEDLGFEERWLVIDVATVSGPPPVGGRPSGLRPAPAGTFMRVGEHRYRWEFRLGDGETAADSRPRASPRCCAPWVDGRARLRTRPGAVTEYTFRAQLADRWRRGRVFLLGDAAHLTPPFIGQGMGAGLRDA